VTARAVSPGPEIEFDSKARALRIRDPRLIKASQIAFCHRLLEAATRRPGISKAEIDIDAASCRIEFGRGAATAQKMADAFADCVREAAASASNLDHTLWNGHSADSLTLTAYPLSGDVSLWETRQAAPGQIQVRHQSPGEDRERLAKLAGEISRLGEVERCAVLPQWQGLTIDLRRKNGDLNGFLDEAQRSLEHLLAAGAPQPPAEGQSTRSPGDAVVDLASGPKRAMYFILAGGAFAMTLVGLVLPGIPTVPFLLATSYFLARSSRRLNRRLNESIFFGSILAEWREHGALSRASKAKLLALTAVIVSVAIFVGPLSLFGIVFVLLVSSLSVFGIIRLPSLSEGGRTRTSSDLPSRLALSAP
jgi:uncharacterized membrane protein YbaN (DUF454 family)